MRRLARSILSGYAKSGQVDLLLPRAAIVWCGCTDVARWGCGGTGFAADNFLKRYCRCVMRDA